MGVRFIGSLGDSTDVAFLNLPASGVISVNGIVEWLRNGTGGAVIGPASSSSTTTMIFGASQSYATGASDTFAKVIPFADGQLWEVDCANAATTAQLGIRHALSASARDFVHNTATDIGANAAVATRATGVFLALAMSGPTTGSGKLIGRFLVTHDPVTAPSQV